MKNLDFRRWIISSALLIVLIIVIWSFTLIGSPSFNRKLSADKMRIVDLRQISFDVESYFEREKKLPDVLDVLRSQKSRFGNDINIVDPTTTKSYEYIKKDLFSYEICADFELTSQEVEIDEPRHNYFAKDRLKWEHGIGRSCFPFEIPISKRSR